MSLCRVDIWTLPLDAPREAVLSREEQARAARFRFERDRVRWANARSALRVTLADRLQLAPLDIRFSVGEHGKPGVDGVEFNISHSGGWAMIALTERVPVGIDIEAVRENVEIAKLLRRIGEPDHDGSRGELFQRWTRREAKTKALGTPLMEMPEGDLRVADLRAPEGFAASVALIGCDPEIGYHGS